MLVDVGHLTMSSKQSEAVFLVVCDPSVNELGATYTHRDIFIDLSRSLTAHS